jgi:hypothetical protein
MICTQGQISSPNFGVIFFQGAPKEKKIAAKTKMLTLKKKKGHKNYKGPLPLPLQKMSTN